MTSVLVTWQSRLCKPHFIFRPRQVATRLRESHAPYAGSRERLVHLPWGTTIECLRDEHIGSALARIGIYDLAVSEALARLIDEGDSVLDAGANIGYMTSLMAWRAGASGSVMCFEPNPAVLDRLQRNVDLWQQDATFSPVEIHRVALSESDGHATLRATANFEHAMGTASLTEHSADEAALSWEVQTRRLDSYVGHGKVGMLKLDVEGHELSVMEGAREAFAAGRIRDVLLEDRGSGPSAKLDFLASHGFAIFNLDQGLLGLRVTAGVDVPKRRIAFDPQTFLATRDPQRAVTRLGGLGWTSLNPRLFARRKPRAT
jgi:FkbM family methyltransferase